jgi:hypothetical protein
LLWVVGGAVGLLCVILVAVLALNWLSSALFGGHQVLLGFPDPNGEVDLALLKLGQDEEKAIEMADDVTRSEDAVFAFFDDGMVQGLIGETYGGFIPNTNRLICWYQDDGGDTVVEGMVGKKGPTEIMDTDDYLVGTAFADSDTVLLKEARSGQQRFYTSKPGEEAERLIKGDLCRGSVQGHLVYATDVDGDETTLSTVKVNGKNETVVLEDVEDMISFKVSDDDSHIAYLQDTGSDQQLYLAERKSGDVEEASDEMARVMRYGFLLGGDVLYYIADDGGGERELYTSEDSDPIAEGRSIEASPSSHSQDLAYLVTEEDGEEAVYVYSAKSGDEVEVLRGEDLEYHVTFWPPKILIYSAEDDEIAVYSTNTDGSNRVELFRRDDVTLSGVETLAQGETIYIELEDNGLSTLLAAPGGDSEAFELLDGWYHIRLLNDSSNGSQLVFWAREDAGDDPILYAIAVEEDADPVELDDDHEGFRNAVFLGNDRKILYTATTGNNADDVEVCRVPADGSDDFEVLYEEALLVDVSGLDLFPFSASYWQWLRSDLSSRPGRALVHRGH